MSHRRNTMLSPGLLNLILVECLFLSLAVYLGLILWAGMSAARVFNLVFCGVLLYTSFDRRA